MLEIRWNGACRFGLPFRQAFVFPNLFPNDDTLVLNRLIDQPIVQRGRMSRYHVQRSVMLESSDRPAIRRILQQFRRVFLLQGFMRIVDQVRWSKQLMVGEDVWGLLEKRGRNDQNQRLDGFVKRLRAGESHLMGRVFLRTLQLEPRYRESVAIVSCGAGRKSRFFLRQFRIYSPHPPKASRYFREDAHRTCQGESPEDERFVPSFCEKRRPEGYPFTGIP